MPQIFVIPAGGAESAICHPQADEVSDQRPKMIAYVELLYRYAHKNGLRQCATFGTTGRRRLSWLWGQERSKSCRVRVSPMGVRGQGWAGLRRGFEVM